MKKLIIIALVLSIATGFAAYYYISNLEKNFRVKTRSVAVAVKTIPKNTVIEADMVAVKQYPEDTVNRLAVVAVDELKGRVTKETIEADEQILSTKLSSPDAKSDGLSYAVKEGFRAVTLKTDEISGIAGRLAKGDKVDVIAVMTDRNASTGVSSQMIAENIEILELGVKPSSGEEKSGGNYSSVTLSVSAADVLKLNFAISEGKCNLTLRSVLDNAIAAPLPYSP